VPVLTAWAGIKVSAVIDIWRTTVCRGSATAAGVLFRSWNAGGEGSAAIVFDWERNVLEAVFEGAGLDLGSTPDLDPEDDSLRRVGGPAEHVQVRRLPSERLCECCGRTVWDLPQDTWLLLLHHASKVAFSGYSRLHTAYATPKVLVSSSHCSALRRTMMCTCGCCWTTRPWRST